MDKPEINGIFCYKISYFDIDNFNVFKKKIVDFLKTYKYKKISNIKNFESKENFDNLIHNQNFQPLINYIKKYIDIYVSSTFNKINYKFQNIFIHIDNQNDMNTTYNFSKSDFTFYFCIQNKQLGNNDLTINNPHTEDICFMKVFPHYQDEIKKKFNMVPNVKFKYYPGKVIVFPSHLLHYFNQNFNKNNRIFLVVNIKF